MSVEPEVSPDQFQVFSQNYYYYYYTDTTTTIATTT